MTIDGRALGQHALPAALPWRPDDGGGGSTEPVRPLLPGRADEPVDAEALATLDPLRPTAADGWSPDRIVPVRSRNEGGFLGSAVNFTLGGVDERPGQRLSVAQVDQLAPFFAKEFGLDEGYVRRELAKVYLYVGGPSVGSSAMTIGHHVFMPTADALERIVSPSGRRWLTHELAHTMQFLAYQQASPHEFLAEYISSLVIGRDPQQPGTGGGQAVWGALFTGLRATGRTEDDLNRAAEGLREKLAVSVLPGAVTSLPVAFAAGGALAAARATSGRRLLGTGNAMTTMLGTVAAPVLAGSAIGMLEDRIGVGGSTALGAVAGGLLAGGALARGGAFRVGGSTAATAIGRSLGRGTAIGLATGLTMAGMALGGLAANASANTIRGGAAAADLISDMRMRTDAGCATCNVLKQLDFQDAMHDAHWLELDAEAIARRFVRNEWERPAPGDLPFSGRIPSRDPSLLQRIDTDVSNRLDWGVKVPLIVGIPAAIGLGAGILATRTGATVLRTTLREGKGPFAAVGAALELLGSRRQGLGNSMGVGAAVTVAPLVAGGIAGPIIYNATGSETAARFGGAGVAAVATGALLTLLLKGRGSGLIGMSGKVGVGMAVAGGLGLLAAGVATDALRPQQRGYDVSRFTPPR